MTTSGMSDVEKLAFSVDASLRGSDSKSSVGASRGVRLAFGVSRFVYVVYERDRVFVARIVAQRSEEETDCVYSFFN